MRFGQFNKNWERHLLEEICVINPKTEKLADEFIYIDLESVVKGELINKNIISKKTAPSRAQRVLRKGDICYQCVRPYQLNNYYFNNEDNNYQWVASTGYAQIRTDNNPLFLYQLLNSPRFNREVMLRCTGTSYPAINSNDLGEIEVAICSIGEQIKISDFLQKIDERIHTQSKIIKGLKTLKKSICERILGNRSWIKYRISEIGKLGRGRVISTSEINSSTNPQYPVYSSQTSNNGIMGYLDTYEFEGEYITWTTDGANAGTVFYRNGKFNCTNVCGTIKLDNTVDAYFVAYALQQAAKKYVSTNLANPKLMNNVMSDISILCPDLITQTKIGLFFRTIDTKIAIEEQILNGYNNIKRYLLNNLFI